ncbi:guanine nucleotide exchange factor MSS4 homolog [Leguminivora glycinivorella]|uniref:guanine nucleotide exchange factor MSS4 homolog n=1 Tax=Leguminivora glycinivorella TaxID=1035111 RepID=UPI00200C245A|nr:guanine nucleotide exchange factor MSS4 homolog [Leguminivora glycinivorella]XP_048006788.1 guanine nucleotide exchange factor MSS4 homolog [Leguminivora glycinivorella]
MADVENKEDLVEDGKNKMNVKCKFCSSKILDKKSANYITQEMALPLMQQDNNRKEGEIQNETVSEFYHVENMYTFENIGFTHTVDNYKYLSCADCDAGPVGYYDMNTKQSYVALSRIVHS